MKKPKTYYIEATSGWFITKCWSMRQARQESAMEYGRTVKIVRLATADEIKHFLALKGKDALG